MEGGYKVTCWSQPGLGPSAVGPATAAVSLPWLLGSSTPNRSTRELLVPETTSTELYRAGLFKKAKKQRKLTYSLISLRKQNTQGL